MSAMAGNPNFDVANALCASPNGGILEAQLVQANAEATLALAYEQRTANLIALYSDGSDGPAPGVDYTVLIEQITERLGIA